MIWNVTSASVPGTSHDSSGTPCQDTCFAEEIRRVDGSTLLVCLVSDGAGSATFAATGSSLACETAVASIKASWPIGLRGVQRDVVEAWINNVQVAIRDAAVAAEATPRDFACTLLGAVVGHDFAVFFQIGDGAIVVSNGSTEGVVFWPESGPYANMTHFVTDEDAQGRLQVETISMRVEDIALFSDGIQRLALSYETKMPHQPFFEPMFNVLRSRQADDCEALCTQLARFLDSDPVNERTDDDKTLVLATRRNALNGLV